jgi:hypothetical protein
MAVTPVQYRRPNNRRMTDRAPVTSVMAFVVPE